MATSATSQAAPAVREARQYAGPVLVAVTNPDAIPKAARPRHDDLMAGGLPPVHMNFAGKCGSFAFSSPGINARRCRYSVNSLLRVANTR
ncbi:MAG: hypothetical protein R3C10_25105 [Pirellulales bacterium]